MNHRAWHSAKSRPLFSNPKALYCSGFVQTHTVLLMFDRRGMTAFLKQILAANKIGVYFALILPDSDE
jgi:hypothetical protein